MTTKTTTTSRHPSVAAAVPGGDALTAAWHRVQTVTLPLLGRWWRAQGQYTKLAVVAATIFALVGVVDLASAGIGRLDRAAPVTANAPAALALSAEAAPTDATRTWNVTKVWQGSGTKETEEFTVAAHWRVDWIFSPVQTGAILQVFIYQGDGRLLLNVATDTQKAGADTSFWVGPGKYFLRVNATGGDWKIAVQDLR